MATCVLRLLCSTLRNGWLGSGAAPVGLAKVAVFYFYIFHFRFLQKYIFIFEIYRNIPRPPRCRAAGTWPPGSGAAGAFLKKFRGENCVLVPGGRSPCSGAAGPGRLAAGQPALPPLYKGWLVPHPSFASLQFQKPKKREREGERRSPAGFSSRRLQLTKILLRFTNRLCCNYFF